ncbi:DUF2293 domain-containing protein [Shinella sumterensis]|nr:DUF2293 domain-containing protein [Shinella sumterensis]
MSTFPIEAIVEHLGRKHPGCPDFAIAYFSEEIARKYWKGASLGKAVGITMQTFLRHEMTDYDALLLSGVDRQEARRRVQPRVNAMIRSWSKKPKASRQQGLRRIADV